MKSKLKIGQIVYGDPRSNELRNSKEIKEFTVESLGNKYFKLKDESGTHRLKFSYETMQEVSEYATDWKIYLSKKEIQDRIEKPNIIKTITNKLELLSVDELNAINRLLTVK